MSEMQLDRLDKLILNAIQSGFPVEARPYKALAEKLNQDYHLDLSEEETWSRVKSLRDNGFIRRMGGIFNAGPLGYRSVLCAARVPEDKLALFSQLVNQAHQVTHNYLRSNSLNVWFTFSSDRPEALESFLAELKRKSGVEEIHLLEAEKLFKIKVDFKFNA